MSILSIFIIAGAAILSFMTVLWLISLVLRNSSIIDIFWGALTALDVQRGGVSGVNHPLPG